MRTLLAVLSALSLTAGCSSGGAGNGTTGGGAGATGGGTTTGIGTTSSTVVTGTGDGGPLVLYGDTYTGGQYNLGPVDWAETQFHNACAPIEKYPASVQAVEGTLLAGLWDGIPNVASYCDACIWVTTAKGRSALLRVVTYGSTSMNSIDVSPDAYQILNDGEYPRDMTWQFAECPATGPMIYEFQTGSNEWWTSLWVRNARVPLSQVEVESPNHSAFAALMRGGDGTLTDGSGFGQGMFTIRSTGVDGHQVEDAFPWPSSGIAGAMLTGQGNFP
jgi:expansin (peptidoglycan-binding protein)